MNIIIAADSNFREQAEFSIQKVKEFGYKPVVYDLGGLGFGKALETEPVVIGEADGAYVEFARSYSKPQIVRDAFNGKDFLVWLDADAFIIKPLGGILTDDYDVGVTMRRQRERGKSRFPNMWGYLNTGVIFFNHTDKASEFIDKWEEKRLTLVPQDNQYALNELVREVTDLTEYDKVFVRDDGIRIKVFRCEEYNCFYFQEGISDEAKILHFKGRYRSEYYEHYRLAYPPVIKPPEALDEDPPTRRKRQPRKRKSTKRTVTKPPEALDEDSPGRRD